MTAYHLYTRTKPVRWYDPFRLDSTTKESGDVAQQTKSKARVYSLSSKKGICNERSA